MALDFTILDDTGRSIDSVPIGVDQHWRLFGSLLSNEWPLLSRLRDYYGDAAFSVAELDGLQAEINALSAGKFDNSDREVLQRLLEVTHVAKKIGRSIDIQAD